MTVWIAGGAGQYGWADLIRYVVPAALALAGAMALAWLQARTEIMKLRHSVAERRVRGFDAEADNLRTMALEIHRLPGLGGQTVPNVPHRLCDAFLVATLRMTFAWELAMMDVHRERLSLLRHDLLLATRDLCRRLMRDPGTADGAEERRQEIKEMANRVLLLVHLHMEAVDVSSEAMLIGYWWWPKYILGIWGIRRRWLRQRGHGAQPRPDGGA